MLASRAQSLTFGARYARTVASPCVAEGWRHNKTNVAHWVEEASTQPNSKAKREFYGYLQMSCGDVDVDKDSKINPQEFDNLCEKLAAMPVLPHLGSLSTVAPSRSELNCRPQGHVWRRG